jgi:hypothetical protein
LSHRLPLKHVSVIYYRMIVINIKSELIKPLKSKFYSQTKCLSGTLAKLVMSNGWWRI